jgi:hypothetical protein
MRCYTDTSSNNKVVLKDKAIIDSPYYYLKFINLTTKEDIVIGNILDTSPNKDRYSQITLSSINATTGFWKYEFGQIDLSENLIIIATGKMLLMQSNHNVNIPSYDGYDGTYKTYTK